MRTASCLMVMMAALLILAGVGRGRAHAPDAPPPADQTKRVRELIAALRAPGWLDRYGAADGLAALGPAAREAVPALVAALKDDSVPVQTAAARALKSIGPADRAAARALLDALRDSDDWTRAAAAEALKDGPVGKEVRPVLLEALKGRNPAAAAGAAAALGKLGQGDGEIVQVLRAAYRHPDPGVRAAVAASLETLRPADAASAPAVVKLAESKHVIALAKARAPLAFNADGTLLATGTADGVIVWDVATGKERATLGDGSGPALCLAFTADGKTVVAGSAAGVKLWDLGTGKARTFPNKAATPLTLAADGSAFLTPGEGDTIQVWDLIHGKEPATLRIGMPRDASLTLAPDGRLLAGVRSDRTIHIWDTASGRELAHVRAVPSDWDTSWKLAPLPMAFTPDGTFLAYSWRLWTIGRFIIASTIENGGVVVWDTANGKHSLFAREDVSVPVLAVTPDGLTLACTVVPTPKGGFVAPLPSPAAIELWDVPTGKLRATFEEVPGGGAALAFSPDGRMLASGGPEGVLLWELGKLLGQKENK
jgi:WD40 repeat protein